jgi:hypothetical protein
MKPADKYHPAIIFLDRGVFMIMNKKTAPAIDPSFINKARPAGNRLIV